MKKGKKGKVIFFLIVLSLIGCNYYIDNDEEDVKKIDKIMEKDFVGEYSYSDKRINYDEVVQTYLSQVNEINKQNNKNIKFNECMFGELPDTDSFALFVPKQKDITVEDSIACIKNNLKDIGNTSIVLDDVLRDDSGTIPYDENTGEWPLVYDNFDILENGNGFYINLPEYSIQMGQDGIYSFSNGPEARMLIFDDSFEYGKEITGDRAEKVIKYVEDYFAKGTPFEPFHKIKSEVISCKEIQIGERYGYALQMRRLYDNVPFAYKGWGISWEADEYSIDGDTKFVFMLSDESIDGFIGYNEAEQFDVIYEDNKIIDIKTAISILNDKLAKQMKLNINKVQLVYANISKGNEYDIGYYVPCWEFIGKDNTSDYNIAIYVDAFSEEVYLYQYEED